MLVPDELLARRTKRFSRKRSSGWLGPIRPSAVSGDVHQQNTYLIALEGFNLSGECRGQKIGGASFYSVITLGIARRIFRQPHLGGSLLT
jgi:hypothetical protein